MRDLILLFVHVLATSIRLVRWFIENTGCCFPQNTERNRDRKAETRI
jgi:hypothetical protein